MKEKRFPGLSLRTLALLAALVLSVIIVIPRSTLRFTGLQNVQYFGDRAFGININKTQTDIFEISTETGEGTYISAKQVSRKGTTVFADLDIAGDGEVYILKEEYRDGEGTSFSVIRWNREKNRLEDAVAVPKEIIADCRLVDFCIRDGNFGLLFYKHDENGEGTYNAYALSPEGTYVSQENKTNASADDWDFSVTGVSLKDMPYTGVRLPLRVTLLRMLAVFLILLAGMFLLWVAWEWWKTRPYRPGLLVRLAVGTAAGFLLFVPLFSEAMRYYLFNYTSRNEIYTCMVESELYSRIMDRNILDDIVEGKSNLDTDRFREMLKSDDGISVAVFWYSGKRLYVLGDLFEKGIYHSSMTEGSLKDCVDEVWGTEEPRDFLYAGRRSIHALVMRPEKTASGLDAVLCVQTPMRKDLQNFQYLLHRVVRTCEWMALAVLVTVLLIIFLSMSPLRRLRNAVASLAEGNLDARVQVFGHNEVVAASREFNLMAEELEKTREGADIYRRFYEAFWPIDLMRKIAGKRLNTSLKPGSSLTTDAVVLILKVQGVQAAGTEVRKDLLSGLLGLVKAHGGSAVRFTEEQLTAVYPGPVKEALTCAVLMQRMVEEKTGLPGRMGMAAGPVGLRVVEVRDRRALLTETMEDAGRLCALSEIWQEGLITTEAVFKAAAECGSEFHFRHLGMVSVDGWCPGEELYELLDAETPEQRKVREDSAGQFEAGVRAYAAKDYFRARIAMISCLASDAEDRAARSYCMNCDRKEPPVICQAER